MDGRAPKNDGPFRPPKSDPSTTQFPADNIHAAAHVRAVVDLMVETGMPSLFCCGAIAHFVGFREIENRHVAMSMFQVESKAS